MIEDLGESANLALGYARRFAQELGSEEIGTEHLFLAVAELEDVVIRQQFTRLRIDLEEICGEIRQELGPGTGERRRDPPLSERANRALYAAQERAAFLGSELVEAPHILMAVLNDYDGLAVRTLMNAGAKPESLDKQLNWMLANGKWSADFYKRRKAVEQPDLSKTGSVLDELGRDLTAAAERGELNPIIGRERELVELIQVLCGKRKNNAVLIGEAGVGKTAIVEDLAQRIVSGQIPDQLKGMRIRTIEIGSLVAGTVFRGMFEQRLKDLIEEASRRTDLILFLDEIHMLIGAGESGQGSMDAANILKPVLSQRRLKVVGATTTDEFRKYFEKDSALMRRFQAIVVGEPSREATLRILEGLRPRYQEFHGVEIADDGLAAAVDLSARYMHGRFLPDKAIDLIDRACTQKRLARSMREWMPLFAQGDRGDRAGKVLVGADDVAEVISILLEIPIATMKTDEKTRLLSMPDALKRRVVGQDHAVDTVSQAILAARAGMGDPARPYGVFLLLGPTGVGKTKLAKELAGFLFGDEDELVRLDMSEYADRYTVSGLLGAPPGYVGFEEGGELTNAVRAKPYSVVLLDEMEKAHPEVWNVFLQVFDDGRLTDKAGRLVDFRNTVILMTSNVGSRQIQASKPFGFVAATVEDERELSDEDVRREVDKELKRVFAPELLNRIDEVIVFHPISKDSLRTIIGQLVEEMVTGVTVELSDEVSEFLLEQSYDPALGARPARRAIMRLLRNPLSMMLLRGEIEEGDAVAVTLRDGALMFETDPSAKEKAPA
jgi:ATP-dependent Clp protease ATP-binding subunit ClpC